MPDDANKLMMENLSKYLIYQDEYPMTRVYYTPLLLTYANYQHTIAEVIHTRCKLYAQ